MHLFQTLLGYQLPAIFCGQREHLKILKSAVKIKVFIECKIAIVGCLDF